MMITRYRFGDAIRQGYPADVESADERTVRDLIMDLIRTVNTKLPSKQISNSLCQAAMLDARRWQEHDESNWGDVNARAKAALWQGRAVACVWAQGSPQVITLGDALLSDKVTREIIDDPRWTHIGGGVGGGSGNLIGYIYVGEYPEAQPGPEPVPENLADVGLRDGLEYGNEHTLEIFTGVG